MPTGVGNPSGYGNLALSASFEEEGLPQTMELGSARKLKWSRVSRTTIDADGPLGSLSLSREGLTATLVGSKIYTVGGGLGSGVGNLRVLDIATRSWKVMRLPTAVARKNHVAFLWNEFLYVYSGTSSDAVLTDMQRIDISNEADTQCVSCYWHNLSPLKLRDFAASFCEVSRELVITGGVAGAELVSQTVCFDPQTHRFVQPKVSGRVPRARSSHASCSVNNKVFIHAGWADGRLCPLVQNDIHVLTIVGSSYSWSQVDHGGGVHATSATMTFSDGKLFILGDSFSMHASSLRVFSLEQRRWLQIEENAKGDRHEADLLVVNETPTNRDHAVVLAGNKLVLFGGYSVKGWEYCVLQPYES